jgi:ketosteroid isomerase-like protein
MVKTSMTVLVVAAVAIAAHPHRTGTIHEHREVLTTRSEAGTGELPPALAAALKQFDQATVNNDIATLGHLVTDDYVLVNSDASVENKQQYLADFNLPGFKIEPSVREQPVEKVWNDAAVVGGLVHLNWTQDGQHQARLIRIAHVWALRDGQWRLTYTQVTRAPNQ